MNLKTLFFCIVIIVVTSRCKNNNSVNSYSVPDWAGRKVNIRTSDSISVRTTYLPVYAQIYHNSEEQKVDLAVTVSVRNTDIKNKLIIRKIDYYNTHGKLIRQYIDSPIYINPAETIEIVMESAKNEGGTGANFIFEWMKDNISPPLFESVMISTTGQQGIAFTCRGVELD